MPTYEYKCGECGHLFEKFSPKISDESSAECPKCEGLAERLISGGAGLLFKGSGFHATDYRSKSYKDAAKKEKETQSGASGEAKPSAGGKKQESKKDSK
jgi:putative FmdB family regulatory protein